MQTSIIKSIDFFNAFFNAKSTLCARHQTDPTHDIYWRTIVISLFFMPVFVEPPSEPRNTILDNKCSKFVPDICIKYWFRAKSSEIFPNCFSFVIYTLYTFNYMKFFSSTKSLKSVYGRPLDVMKYAMWKRFFIPSGWIFDICPIFSMLLSVAVPAATATIVFVKNAWPLSFASLYWCSNDLMHISDLAW